MVALKEIWVTTAQCYIFHKRWSDHRYVPCPLIPWPSSDFSPKLTHLPNPDAIFCKDPAQLRRHGFPGLWLLGSQDYRRPFRKKKIKRLHKMRWDFTDIQADFRRQLENRTLLHPPSPFPNKCHMSVHDAFWLTALWLTFDTEKMPKHLGPSFPFSSLLQSYLIRLRGKWTLW